MSPHGHDLHRHRHRHQRFSARPASRTTIHYSPTKASGVTHLLLRSRFSSDPPADARCPSHHPPPLPLPSPASSPSSPPPPKPPSPPSPTAHSPLPPIPSLAPALNPPLYPSPCMRLLSTFPALTFSLQHATLLHDLCRVLPLTMFVDGG